MISSARISACSATISKSWGAGAAPLFPSVCCDPPPPAACSDSVQVSITMQDTLPLISWTPDCLIGRVLIEEGINELYRLELGLEFAIKDGVPYAIDFMNWFSGGTLERARRTSNPRPGGRGHDDAETTRGRDGPSFAASDGDKVSGTGGV